MCPFSRTAHAMWGVGASAFWFLLSYLLTCAIPIRLWRLCIKGEPCKERLQVLEALFKRIVLSSSSFVADDFSFHAGSGRRHDVLGMLLLSLMCSFELILVWILMGDVFAVLVLAWSSPRDAGGNTFHPFTLTSGLHRTGVLAIGMLTCAILLTYGAACIKGARGIDGLWRSCIPAGNSKRVGRGERSGADSGMWRWGGRWSRRP